MSQIIPVEVQLTFRDGDQSNKGTKMSAEDFVAQAPNVHNYGIQRVQTTGGTFWAEPARAGRWPEQFNQTIGDHFGKGNLIPSALYRSIFGLAMSPQSLSSHERQMKILAEQGRVKVLQNFHGMNDTRLMGFVPKVAADHGMTAMAGLCVQVSPITMDKLQEVLDQHYRDLEEMLKQGHKGIYLKNANGVLIPEFVEPLVRGVRERFGYEHEIGIHTHNTYGLAIQTYLAAMRANEGKGRIVVDVLPEAAADGTAQPSLQMLLHAMKYSNDPLLVASIPQGINMAAIEQDAGVQYRLRGIYRQHEMEYDPVALQEALEAGEAGGAIGVLKGQKGIRDLLARTLGTDEWAIQRSAVFRAIPTARQLLGYPTDVTPYQNMKDSAAAQIVPALKNGKDPIGSMVSRQDVRSYAVGAWGRVSADIDPELQYKALQAEGHARLTYASEGGDVFDRLGLTPEERKEALRRDNARHLVIPKTAEELPDGLEVARNKLIEAGLKDPTDAEAHLFAMIGNEWKPDCPARKLIEGTRSKTIQPLARPELPIQMQDGKILSPVVDEIFEAVYKALEAQKLREGFYKGMEQSVADRYAAQLEASVHSVLEQGIRNGLRDEVDGNYMFDKRKPAALARILKIANHYLMDIAAERGVSSENRPAMPQTFELSHGDQLLQLMGWDEMRNMGGNFARAALGDVEKFAKRWGKMAERQGHNFLSQYLGLNFSAASEDDGQSQHDNQKGLDDLQPR